MPFNDEKYLLYAQRHVYLTETSCHLYVKQEIQDLPADTLAVVQWQAGVKENLFHISDHGCLLYEGFCMFAEG